MELNKYTWSKWQIILWLLFIIPGLIHEIWRRYRVTTANNKMDTQYINKEKLELERLRLPTSFIIERQLAFLQANEVFFKNMILKANDPKFLEKIRGKSISTFLRENNNLVNFENNERTKKSNSDDKIYEKVVPESDGSMKNTHRININGKVYFTKKGKMFLDKKTDIDLEQDMEEYRGNLDEENSLENQNNLIDTASHGCIMKAFDNILGLNVLVDTKLIVTPDGYDVFMKSADGENARDVFKKLYFDGERSLSFMTRCEEKKREALSKLANNLLSRCNDED